jgi:hypothetical protein
MRQRYFRRGYGTAARRDKGGSIRPLRPRTAGVLFGLLYLVYRRPHERAEDVHELGSAEELEVRMTAIDENV